MCAGLILCDHDDDRVFFRAKTSAENWFERSTLKRPISHKVTIHFALSSACMGYVPVTREGFHVGTVRGVHGFLLEREEVL